jgi:subtilisin family serine protease
VTIVEFVERLGVYRLRIPRARTVAEMVEVYRTHPRIEFAEPNHMGRGGDVIPDDTFFLQQWYLRNIGQTLGRPDADIDAVEGWQITQGREAIVVAVLDTGVDVGHPEFAGRLLPGFDFVNNDADPQADHPHGVQVSGILAANSDNQFAMAGIAQHVRLLPVKVLNSVNAGTVLNLAQGLIFAAASGADVISMSLINYPASSATLTDALRIARTSGATLIACAGNGGLGDADRSGPGASPLTIAVGATDHNDRRAAFSGTGSALDVVAPGLALPTITSGGSNAVVSFSGCSAATPVVAGIAVLLRSIDPLLTHEEIQYLLAETAQDLVGLPAEDTPGRDDFFGHGRVNMHDALTASLRVIVDPYVTFDPLPSTYVTTTSVIGCPAGFAGTFAFDATITNVSASSLRHLSSHVTTLTNGNVLRAIDEDTRGTGGRVPVPRSGYFADATLAPGESVQSRFFICLTERQPFELFVNVLGIVDEELAVDAP